MHRKNVPHDHDSPPSDVPLDASPTSRMVLSSTEEESEGVASQQTPRFFIPRPTTRRSDRSSGSARLSADECECTTSSSISSCPDDASEEAERLRLMENSLTLALKADAENDARTNVPFEITEETFPIPRQCCDDDVAGGAGGWRPGSKLRIAYLTWNMASRKAQEVEVAQHFIFPNAHIVVVATQENGPYVGSNDKQREWEAMVSNVCLRRKYTCVQQTCLCALHLMVFVRKVDVLPYITRVEVGSVKTGFRGMLGNKGGVAVAFSMEVRAPGRATSSISILCINAHLAAHQSHVSQRNDDYSKIVEDMKVGRQGEHYAFFKGCPNGGGGGGASSPVSSTLPRATPSEDGVALMRLPSSPTPASSPNFITGRDVTTEFDVVFFGGDLNYRLNGTTHALQHILNNELAVRSVLTLHDQLNLERARGLVFRGFTEGQLHFRPTYKYEVQEIRKGYKRTLNTYVNSITKPRLPSYCDRVLFRCNHAQEHLSLLLYTDVPQVRTSDHRPVAALFELTTNSFVERA